MARSGLGTPATPGRPADPLRPGNPHTCLAGNSVVAYVVVTVGYVEAGASLRENRAASCAREDTRSLA